MKKSVERYSGTSITLEIHSERCIHSRQCVLHLPDVWMANVPGAWVHPDAADVHKVVAIAERCPSGAIQYQRLDGCNETPPLVNTLRVTENGPLAIHADLAVEGDVSSTRATLCRCGASRNKPYCDGSHAALGFRATGEPDALPSASVPLASRGGVLEVRRLANGPLKVGGPLEVIGGSGRAVHRATTVHLCRCGASNNKPFCDGSHVAIGFIDQGAPA